MKRPITIYLLLKFQIIHIRNVEVMAILRKLIFQITTAIIRLIWQHGFRKEDFKMNFDQMRLNLQIDENRQNYTFHTPTKDHI